MRKSWKPPDWDSGARTDYDRYRLSPGECLLCLGKSLLLTGAFSYMFYRSWLGMLSLPAAAAWILYRDRRGRRDARKERLALQFKDTILSVSANLQAGYSIENAFLESEAEICTLHGPRCEMALELALLRKGLKNRVPLEQILSGLGARSHIEEIRDFAECFSAAKHLGGNLREIISRTAELTGQRMDVEREIRTMLSARKYEQKVMNLIPFLLFGYMQISSKGFFDVLYYNTPGICIMTACLLLYLAALFLSEKIMDIRL